jgi:hypothetical protein
LFFLRFYPTSIAGFSFTGIALIILIAWLGISTGAVNWMLIQTGQATPQPDPVIQTTPTLALIPTITPTSTSAPATAAFGVDTLTPSRTPTPKPTTLEATEPPIEAPTSTITAEPTPIVALIKASEGGGAFIREKPGGKVLVTLGNGSTVIIVPNDLQDVNNVIWVHVYTTFNDKRVEGWMIQSVLVTATPLPDWRPSSTPTVTPNQ